MTDEALASAIRGQARKLKTLEKAGPGAGMAAAVCSVHLSRLRREAEARGLQL